MVIPHWSTIALSVALVVQFIVSWLQAKNAGRRFRETVLPNALMAGGVSIIFVRDFFGDLPPWVDAPAAVLCLLLILIALGLWLVQLKRYLKEAWRLEDKREK